MSDIVGDTGILYILFIRVVTWWWNDMRIHYLPQFWGVCRVRAIFWKHSGENVSFHNLMVEDEIMKTRNHLAQQIFPTHKTKYSPNLMKANLQTQPAFICLNSAIIIVQ